MVKILIILSLIVAFTNGQNKTCFSQQEFEKAYEDESKNYRDYQLKLKSVDDKKCGIPESSSIFAHFHSSFLSQEILEHDFFATVTNSALKTLRNGKNFTRSEFRACLSNIVTSKYCKPLQPICTFGVTRFVACHDLKRKNLLKKFFIKVTIELMVNVTIK